MRIFNQDLYMPVPVAWMLAAAFIITVGIAYWWGRSNGYDRAWEQKNNQDERRYTALLANPLDTPTKVMPRSLTSTGPLPVLTEVNWSQPQPYRCYFYPQRDCPGWRERGQACEVMCHRFNTYIPRVDNG
jgi:hypothetical protein